MTGERASGARRARTRGRERRLGLGSVIAALPPLLRRADGQGLRLVFEEGVKRLVAAQSLRLRELQQTSGAPGPIRQSDSTVSVEVPTGNAPNPMVLEAILPPTRRFDDWDVQMLGIASQLAALVLEIEQARTARTASAARSEDDADAALVGSSPVMRRLRDRVERVAATDFTILIEGESGTGKELVAREIHALSRRRSGPFVAVNCAALVETLVEAELFGIEERTATGVRGRRGKFEHADSGTLFLDEVSDLSPAAQAKLLRAIQDLAVERVGGQGTRRVDIRVVAATNRSLRQMVAAGLFRSDLYYRLSGVEVHVPPLRARQSDIPELAAHFLRRHEEARRLELSPAALDALVGYDWPGNVRELERVVERLVALARGERVQLEDLPAPLREDHEAVLLPSLARDDTMRAWGSRYARLVLQRCNQNKRRACKVLGISYHTLNGYLRYDAAYGLSDSRTPPSWVRSDSDPAGNTRD